MATNNFLPFAPTDTGTNLLTQGDYAAATDRTIGNQPGVASSKLVNKAMRQSSFIVSQMAQFLADKTGANILDDGDTTKLLAQINAALLPLAPQFTQYTTGSGNHNPTYVFFIATGSATAGATYTNNGITFTVKSTVAAGLQLRASGPGVPLLSGTLTKTGGTGDNSITFYAVRAPISVDVKMVGGGGGGSGSSTTAAGNGGNGGTGGSTTFGTLLTAFGGVGGTTYAGAGGGTGTITAPATGMIRNGMPSASGFYQSSFTPGSSGGSSFLGPGGPGGVPSAGGSAAGANSGGGGGGGAIASGNAGTGGGGGGGVEATIIPTLGEIFAYAIGVGGTAGAAGTSGSTGAAGGSGVINVWDKYQ